MDEYALYDSFLSHHGILGMKWGVRRFQNLDGSLTPDGVKRYRNNLDNMSKRVKNINNNLGNLTSSFINSSSDSLFGSNKSKSNSIDDIFNSLKGAKLSDIKTDVLDYANRKGVLDFLDSKADDPFNAIRSVTMEKPKSSKPSTKEYKPSGQDPLRALENARRYSDMVSAMQYWKPEQLRRDGKTELGVSGIHAHTALTRRNADKVSKVVDYMDRNSEKFSKSLGESFIDRVKNEDLSKYDRFMNVRKNSEKLINDYSSNPLATSSKANDIAKQWVKDMSSIEDDWFPYGSTKRPTTRWGDLKYPQVSEISSVVLGDSQDNGTGIARKTKPSVITKTSDEGQVVTSRRDTGTSYMRFNNDAVEDFLRRYTS